jgi:two-component system nitrate/nitrite response regulator NarL
MADLRIFLAVAPGLVLHGIHEAIAREEGVSVVGEAHAWIEVIPRLRAEAADVLLLDTRLPGLSPLVALDLLREQFTGIKIVVLSESTEEADIQAVLRRGADGYIVKTIDPRDLAAALRQTAEGLVFHALSLPMPGEAAARAAGLTERELTILKSVARGLSNRSIARELSVTEQTVKFHLTNIYRKLGVPNRLSAARYAYESGLVRMTNDDEEAQRSL